MKSFLCLDQFLCMAFAPLTFRESLRDIEVCLRAQSSKLDHLGIPSAVARNTPANANAARDWRICADFAQSLIGVVRPLHAHESFAVDLRETVYAADTTTIDLCLSVFPWAVLRTAKAAIKLHTLLDLRGNIPTFIHAVDASIPCWRNDVDQYTEDYRNSTLGEQPIDCWCSVGGFMGLCHSTLL